MNLNIIEQGHGPTLVMLHGWGLNSGVFATIAKPLSRRYRVLCVDLPGHGRSPPIETFDLESVTKVLASVIAEPAIWLGWSLGGTFAMSVAARFPGQVRGLLLVNTTARFVKGNGWPFGMHPSFPEQFADELSTDYDATVGRFLTLVARGSPNGTTMLKQLRTTMRGYPPPDMGALQGGLRVLSRTDMQRYLPSIGCTAHMIQGDRDMIVSADGASATCERIGSCAMTLIRGAGHAPFLSHQQEFLDAVTVAGL